MIKINSSGDCVEIGIYKKHSEFSKAINYIRVDQTREYLLSVVLPEVGNGPYSLVVPDFKDFKDDILKINSSVLQNHIYDSNICLSNVQADVNFLKKLIVEKYFDRSKIAFLLGGDSRPISAFDKAFETHFKNGVDLIFSGQVREGVSKIKGVGVGLTPTGDDYLCGLLTGLHFLNINRRQSPLNLDKITDEIYSIAIGKNLISNTALYAAKNGRVTETFKNFLATFKESDLDAIANVGSSSGIDTLIGFIMAHEKEIK